MLSISQISDALLKLKDRISGESFRAGHLTDIGVSCSQSLAYLENVNELSPIFSDLAVSWIRE